MREFLKFVLTIGCELIYFALTYVEHYILLGHLNFSPAYLIIFLRENKNLLKSVLT